MQQKQLPAFQHQRLRPAISDSGHWTSALQQHTCSYLDLRHTTCAYEAATSFSVCAQQFSYSSDCAAAAVPSSASASSASATAHGSSNRSSFSAVSRTCELWRQQQQLLSFSVGNSASSVNHCSLSNFDPSDSTVFQPQLHRQRSDGG
jgi:hypothetical protein